MNTSTLTWAEVCAMPWLKDIPAKIETNKQNKILMSPAANWHGSSQGEIYYHLRRLMSDGRAIVECAVETEDGTRVADVAWISNERWFPNKRELSLPIAPEICVEVLSPSNSREEMLGKMKLYYAAGALEVWLCDENGHMEFFTHEQTEPIKASILCPSYPSKVELE